MRHVASRYIFDDNEVTMDSYTVADAYMFVDFIKPSLLPSVERTRLTLRVRNLTDKIYAVFKPVPATRIRSIWARHAPMRRRSSFKW